MDVRFVPLPSTSLSSAAAGDLPGLHSGSAAGSCSPGAGAVDSVLGSLPTEVIVRGAQRGMLLADLVVLFMPVRGSPRCWPVVRFHTRSVVPAAGDGDGVPSSSPTATDETTLVWPVRGSPCCWPVVWSHTDGWRRGHPAAPVS